MKKYDKSCVYWIHLPNGSIEYGIQPHTDPLTQGYVGVSVRGAEKRFAAHKSLANRGSTLKVHAAIRKYGSDIQVKTLIIGSPGYCLLIENKLRPETYMAGTWNISAGGELTTLGFVHSEESKRKVSDANKGRVRSQATRDAMSTRRKGKAAVLSHSDKSKNLISSAAKIRQDKPWKNPACLKHNWMKACEIHNLLEDGHSHAEILRFYELGRKSGALVRIIDNIKAGWSPSEDTDYLQWLQQYKEANEAALTI